VTDIIINLITSTSTAVGKDKCECSSYYIGSLLVSKIVVVNILCLNKFSYVWGLIYI